MPLGAKPYKHPTSIQCTLLEGDIPAAIARKVLTTHGDILVRGAAASERLGHGVDGQYLKTQGVNKKPVWADVAAGAKISSGSYEGTNSPNRAIPHGLGVTPKIVLITREDARFLRITDQATIIFYVDNEGRGTGPVTAMNSTNFYVGDTANYYGNLGFTYYWVAIG